MNPLNEPVAHPLPNRSCVFDLNLGSRSTCHILAALDNGLLRPYAGRVMCIWRDYARETVLYADLHMLVVDKLCVRG
jgi:hypothetical protein